jgi:hypothetical protein
MTLNKQLSYTFTTIAATTNFATFEFSPTGVPIPTAPAINEVGQVGFWGVVSTQTVSSDFDIASAKILNHPSLM